VVIALWADLEVLFEVEGVDEFRAVGALGPEVVGDALPCCLVLVAIAKAPLLENSHVVEREVPEGRWLRECGPRLASEGGEDNHLFGAGLLLEDTGTFVCRRSGGEDVIDEKNSLTAQEMVAFFAAGQLEGTVEVLEALFAVEEGLLGGEAGAAEGVVDGEGAEVGEGLGNLPGLIEPAPLLAAPVEGDGDDGPLGVGIGGEPFVVECFRDEAGEFVMEMEAAFVFEGMYQLTCAVPGEECGAGKIEGEGAVFAVRAGGRVGLGAVEGESALEAER
jgi:hypothetical protein